MTRWPGFTLAAGLLLVSCAAPPVTLYTLAVSPLAGPASPLARQPTVIAVTRVRLPDYLDSQEILVRHGTVLDPSHTGRWASRLSLSVTETLTARLARTNPDALVTDQPQSATPTYRLLIDISRFDLAIGDTSAQGTVTLEANWLIVPTDAALAERRNRVRIELAGPMRSDAEVVVLTSLALTRLATAIDITHLR